MSRLDGRIAVLLFVILLGVYLANGRTRGDTLPTRYLPLALLHHGTFCLDGMPGFDGSPAAWWTHRTHRCLVSDYPVGPALLALPVYAPFAWVGVALDGAWPMRLEKLAAAIMVAATATLLAVVLSPMTDGMTAVLLSLIFGLATTNLSTNSLALWHADAAGLALVAALYCIVRGRDERTWLARAAFPLTFPVISRPQVVFIVAPLAVYVLMLRPSLARFATWALPPVLFQGWYNAHYFGNPLRTQFPLGGGLFSMNLAEGLYGVLLSPGRGLFVYTPIFLLSCVGAILVWQRGGDGLLRALSVGTVPTVLFYASYLHWSGGSTYGPRYLGDLNASLTMLLLPLLPWVQRSRVRLAVVTALVTISVASHTYGAFVYDGERDATDFVERLWLWQKHPLVAPLVAASPTVARAAEPFLLEPHSSSATGARILLHINAPRLSRGDTLALSLEAENSGATPLELYAGILLSTERVTLFLSAPQTLTTAVPISHPEWFRPMRVMEPRSHFTESRLFRFTVPENMTPGDMWVFAALVEPSSHPWRVMAAAAQALEVRP